MRGLGALGAGHGRGGLPAALLGSGRARGGAPGAGAVGRERAEPRGGGGGEPRPPGVPRVPLPASTEQRRVRGEARSRGQRWRVEEPPPRTARAGASWKGVGHGEGWAGLGGETGLGGTRQRERGALGGAPGIREAAVISIVCEVVFLRGWSHPSTMLFKRSFLD